MLENAIPYLLAFCFSVFAVETLQSWFQIPWLHRVGPPIYRKQISVNDSVGLVREKSVYRTESHRVLITQIGLNDFGLQLSHKAGFGFYPSFLIKGHLVRIDETNIELIVRPTATAILLPILLIGIGLSIPIYFSALVLIPLYFVYVKKVQTTKRTSFRNRLKEQARIFVSSVRSLIIRKHD